MESTVEHYKTTFIEVKCEDGIVRSGLIINMPFIGNEHEPCTLLTDNNQLIAVKMSEVIKVLGKDPRRF